jgi:2-polyprenyl-3-methyl-5-hydroxy-6-metoxy-1,4-benzoquinol methylase
LVKYEDLEGGYSRERTRILLRWVGTGKEVLDLGCYDGRDSEQLVLAGNRVTGVELLPRAAEEARRRGLETVERDLNTSSWDLPTTHYDVVIAGEVIEHVLDPDAFLENVRSCLRRSGRLVITTPNVASLGRRLMLLVGKNPYLEFSSNATVQGFPPVGHVRYFTRKNLVEICAAHGFRLVELTSDGLNLGPWKSVRLARAFPSLSWRFIALFEKREPS